VSNKKPAQLWKVTTYSQAKFHLCAMLLILVSNIALADINITHLNLSPEEKQWLDNNPVVFFGSDQNYAPLEMAIDNQPYGLSYGYIELFNKILPIEFKYKVEPMWKDTYQSLVDNKIDLLTMVKATDDRKKDLAFSSPYIELESAIIVSKLTTDINNIKDLANKRLAVVEGYFWVELLERNYPNVELVFVPSLAKGLEKVAFGSADAMLETYATATYYLHEKAISNLRVAGYAPFKTVYSFAVNKDQEHLLSIINKLLMAIPKDIKQEIYASWINLDHTETFVPRKYYLASLIILALASLISIGLLIFNTTLRLAVKQKTLELQKMNTALEIKVKNRTQQLESANEKLNELVNIDGLTNIYNRRKLAKHITEWEKRALLSECSISVMMLDVDFFKAYNDFYGHLEGDKCLKKIALFLSKYIEHNDQLLVRYGGEEFLLFFPDMTQREAIILQEKIQEHLAKLNIEHKASEISERITLSIGISIGILNSNTPFEKFLHAADAALYRAKMNGRNRAEYEPIKHL
jgi:diguanylate cyclase (GGDEF)-like protein